MRHSWLHDQSTLLNDFSLVFLILSSFFSEEDKIEFHDTRTLEKVCSFSVSMPTHMCTYGPDTLLVKDSFSLVYPCAWLDCSADPPKGSHTLTFKKLKSERLRDWCRTQELLVIATHRRLAAFLMSSGCLKWVASGTIPNCKYSMKAARVTTDGNGNIFVLDWLNECVQMFSTDGKFIRTVLKTGEHGVCSMRCMRWDTKTSSLVVGHHKRGTKQYYLSAVNIKVWVHVY